MICKSNLIPSPICFFTPFVFLPLLLINPSLLFNSVPSGPAITASARSSGANRQTQSPTQTQSRGALPHLHDGAIAYKSPFGNDRSNWQADVASRQPGPADHGGGGDSPSLHKTACITASCQLQSTSMRSDAKKNSYPMNDVCVLKGADSNSPSQGRRIRRDFATR